MPVFKLDKFPLVCRLCLKPNIRPELMVPLSTRDVVLGCTIAEFIQRFTFEIPENKSHLLPKKACLDCLDLLKFYAKYQSKLTTIHRLMDALAELTLSNSEPIEELFSNQSDKLASVFRDLELCSTSQVTVQDLLDEFPLYKIAVCSETVHEESPVDFDIEDSDLDPTWVADELGPEDIEALLLGPKAKRVKKDVQQQQQPDVDGVATPEDANANQKPKRKISQALRKRRAKKIRIFDEPQKCPHCAFNTIHIDSLKKHIETQHNVSEEDGDGEEHPTPVQIQTYECNATDCGRTFPTRSAVDKHYLHDHKQFICDTCGIQVKTISQLEKHQQRHSNKLDHVCPYCQKCFNVDLDLRTHIRLRHEADTSYKCEICGLEYRSAFTRNNHQKTHFDVYDFPCNLCEKKFKYAGALKRHHDTVHEPKRHICQYCPGAYPRRSKLLDHIEAVHKVQMRFICDICTKAYLSQDDLDVHKSCHSNPAPLQCGTCLIVYPTEERVKDHLCITYRDDYICCGRDLRNPYAYNTHMSTKHDQKTNVRVKPQPGVLYGLMKAQRKRVESCPKCETIFATRTQKKLHVESCTVVSGSDAKTSGQSDRSGNEQQPGDPAAVMDVVNNAEWTF